MLLLPHCHCRYSHGRRYALPNSLELRALAYGTEKGWTYGGGIGLLNAKNNLIPDPAKRGSRKKSLAAYIIKVARLGGYLARASDPPPGNTVMWRGLSRLTYIVLGFEAAQNMGN
jgi:hypothetical protein